MSAFVDVRAAPHAAIIVAFPVSLDYVPAKAEGSDVGCASDHLHRLGRAPYFIFRLAPPTGSA